MEQHVARLVSSCGLSHFQYRAWPGIEILVASPPVREVPLPASDQGDSGQDVPERADVAVAVSPAEPLAAPTPMPPPTPIRAGQSAAPPPRPGPVAFAAKADSARTRSLLVSLAQMIEPPSPRVVIVDADVAPATAEAGRPGPRSPTRRGYEAPIHVAYLPAQRSPAATRRFALLDEIATGERDHRRLDDRRLDDRRLDDRRLDDRRLDDRPRDDRPRDDRRRGASPASND